MVKDNSKRIHFCRQLLVCLIGCNYHFLMGLCLGSSTVIIPQLRKEANSTAAVSSEMASWIPSAIAYSATIWVILLSFIGHYIGRKRTFLMQYINSLAAFTVLYFSKTAWHVLICQMMHGLTIAAQTTLVVIMLAEYSVTKQRGIFLAMKTASIYWGIWAANAIGIFTHYKYIGLTGFLCSAFSLIVSFCIPESPYWLASKARYEECAESHRWLKGDDEITENELKTLITTQKERKRIKKPKRNLWGHVRYYLVLYKEPVVYKPLALSMLLTACYLLSGKLIFAVYAIEMMKKITNNESTAHLGVLILDGFAVLGMYLGSILCRFLKRRVLLFVSCAIGIFFMYATSLFLFLIRLSITSDNPYVTITLLVGYSMAMCCGPALFPATIIGELLPIRARSYSVCVFCVAYKLFIGTVLKISPYIFYNFGFDGTFLFFGVCSTICFSLAFKYLPETKDKTLHEIQALFKKNETNAAEMFLEEDKAAIPLRRS